MNSNEGNAEIRMDMSNLFREEVFTDNAVGTLRRLTPVTSEGEPESQRAGEARQHIPCLCRRDQPTAIEEALAWDTAAGVTRTLSPITTVEMSRE